MRKIIPLLVAATILLLAHNTIAQEKIIDVRQNMADALTSVKTAVSQNDWAEALSSFNSAKDIWADDVKPLLVEDEKTEKRFLEYFGRIGEVEDGLSSVGQLLAAKNTGEIEPKVNAIIWSISHHPRGFDVPAPVYKWWDWVFGLGIGLGWCAFAIFFGLYLRRSYYRRYKRQSL
ncbi:MAG: hypothetical protein JSV99_00305 [Planctomycetota bacterium]|nr:MAG: hypothetical protein JSV99_00305 [Planctomycetota bacterium]